MYSQDLITIQNSLASFSPQSKVWVYYSARSFAQNQEAILEQINQYTQNWSSHGSKVPAAGFLLNHNIILLIADTSLCEVSGCSTDSSVRFITQLGKQYQLDFFDRTLVLLLIHNEIVVTNIQSLKNYPTDTLVFNPFFANLQEWRRQFTQSLKESKFERLL